jgi:RNA polymerase sigma factor (sigma-70 family)
MAGSPFHRLFHFGAVGTLSDAQLLDRFASRRDEAAEAAFEELVTRHGPMVLRVCRGVLHDSHDAEDAFQAVFLVLASRAGTIRRSGSVASWLFGVAQRVASRARRGAARRQRLNRLVAERATSEGDLPGETDLDSALLHEEIDDLPERLRAPIVLCYLQGLTYAAAARQLGLSEVAIRGRLARARERLRHRLTRRGVTVPASLLVAGAAGEAQAAVPLTLIQGTVRIALGFVTGHTAAILARGVLNSMLLNQVKIAGTLLLLALGGGFWAWHAFAGAADEGGQAHTVQVPGKAPASAPASKSQPTQPAVAYRLTGSVRVEGTGEPVPGAKFQVLLGDSGQSRDVSSGSDGRFAVDLPPGQARSWTLLPPAGYWAPNNSNSIETFVLAPDHPIHQKDYVVRRGVIWTFRLTRGAARKPVRGGSIGGSRPNEFFMAEADEAGLARLTLPPDGGKLTVYAAPDLASLNAVPIAIERDPQFRPDAVGKMDHRQGRVLLTDVAGKEATITGLNRFEPTIASGKLVVRVDLPEPDFRSQASLSGRVLNDRGRPIAGAKVALGFGEPSRGSAMSGESAHTVTTDARGDYTIRSIPRRDPDGNPRKVFVVATKDGYAGVDTPPITLPSGIDDSPLVLDPIRLAPGVSLSGTVVDPQGRPVVGAWVDVRGTYALRHQGGRTDEKGHFRVPNLPKGLVSLYFEYGPLFAMGKHLADGTDDNLEIRLRPTAEALGRPAAIPEPPALGRPAPPLQVIGWTDSKSRSLADYRGKVVFLDFWGIWCSPCANGMPSLERLKQKYEPHGVIFLSIHTPGDEIGTIRRFLEFKKATLVSALDESRGKGDNSRNGVTADRYGVKGYPTQVMIDRRGNVAFHSGIGTKEGVAAMKALGKEMGLDESTMTEADFHRLWEAFFSREVEKVLNGP